MAAILIVDNYQYRSRLLYNKLAGDGYGVSIIDDINMLPSDLNDSHFDLALLSLEVEEFDTWQILSDIKKKNPNFPVLVYTLKRYDSIIGLKETISMVLMLGNTVRSLRSQLALVK
jgi:DNA-binding NtrC family response regulator